MTQSIRFSITTIISLLVVVLFVLVILSTDTAGTKESGSTQEEVLQVDSDASTSSIALDEETDAVISSTGSTLVSPVIVPDFLIRSFPGTDFSTASVEITKAISGGPPKDGIPALTNPTFVTLSQFERDDAVQAIVMDDNGQIKVYPYNILTWHEIVNDTVAEVPVAITFCPLCGSAVVYDRRLPNGETTFGVSGGLIESNMMMYDRATESLWQQSTGKALAGQYVGTKLDLVPFQLTTLGEVRERYPDALVVSEDTGHQRDYERSPYSGYDTNHDQLVFGVSEYGDEYNTKDIMVVFRVDDVVAATLWSGVAEGDTSAIVAGTDITLRKEGSELSVLAADGTEIPFYFEMWFSVAVQHGDDLITF